VATAVADPFALVAVSVYVVLAVGETDRVLPVTVPIPWSIDRLVPPVTVHVRVLEPPDSMDTGFAVNDEMLGPGCTVTWARAVVLPAALEAVSVYTVVVVGETETELPVTVPTFGLTDRLVARLVVQARVLEVPGVMDCGVAVNDEMLGS